MEIMDILLLAAPILALMFVGFSLKKQYRYATHVFDMLLYFPVITILALIALLIEIFSLLDSISAVLLSGVLVGICLGLLYYSINWALDYSADKYRKFLALIITEPFSIHSFEDYVNGKIDPDKVNIFIRHDVDISIARTLRMARIEKEFRVYSTYFFRTRAEKYEFEEAIPVIKQLHSDSFGIGLHYETLVAAEGDTSKAIKLFENDFERIREFAPVNVVAAHGQKGYRNRDIWENVDKSKLKVSSAYDMKYDLYLSDAGGKRLRNRDGKYLFDRVYEAKPGQIVQVLIHPDWWS